MEQKKENLEVQRYTVDEIMAAMLRMDDEEAKGVLTASFNIVLLQAIQPMQFAEKEKL